MRTITKLWLGLIVMIILSPIGLILPTKFGAGGAWGEWSADEIHKMVGYMPSGMSKLSAASKSPMPDYALAGQESAPIHKRSISYILSAIIGISLVVTVTILIGKIIARNEHKKAA